MVSVTEASHDTFQAACCLPQLELGCIDIQWIFPKALTGAGNDHHKVCHHRHFVDPDARAQIKKKKKPWESMIDIQSGSAVAQSDERHSFVERKSLIKWAGMWLGRIQRQHVLGQTCHSWLLVYLLSSSHTVSKSSQSNTAHIQMGMLFTYSLTFDRLCFKKKKKEYLTKKSLCLFLFTRSKQQPFMMKQAK